MSNNITEYCEDATNSWDGYIYQGKVAIYIALLEINAAAESGNRDTFEKLGLEIEWVEDFSIVCMEDEKIQYRTIHQVKARSDKGLAAYGEAITKLYQKTELLSGIDAAYLHVTKNILCNSNNWEDEICGILRAGKELQRDIDVLQEYYDKDAKGKTEEIAKLTKPGKNTRANRLLKEFNERIGYFKEITIENIDVLIMGLKESLEEEKINNAKNISKECIEKIEIYQYDEEKRYCAIDEIDELIKQQILKYWGNRSDSSWKITDSSLLLSVTMSLSLLVDKHVIFRHKNYNNTNERIIMLTEIEKKLNDNSASLRSEEYYLYQLKKSLMDHCEEFQQECLEESEEDELSEKCKYCELDQFKSDVMGMDESEIKQLLIRIYLDVDKKFDEVGHMDYSNDYRIKNSVFIGIRDVGLEYEKARTGISYRDRSKNRNLLTALFRSSSSKNPVNNICKKLVRNENIQELMMDYEVIISKDIESKSILDDAGNIYEKYRYEKNHILHFKDTAIKPLDTFMRGLEG